MRKPVEMDFVASVRRALAFRPAPAEQREAAPAADGPSYLNELRGATTGGRAKLWLVIAAILLVLLAWIISPRPARAEVVDRIVAIVNNEVITERDLDQAMAARSTNKGAAKTDAATRQESLDRLIDDRLFNQILGKTKVEVSDDDIARAVANILHQNRMSIDQLKSELASKGISYDEYKKQIEQEIRKVKFTNQVIGPQVKITDQDLRDFYQKNQDRFRGSTSAHIAEIVMPLDGITNEAEMKSLGDTAQSIVARARKGTSFDSLAKQYSKGPNAAQGGDLGMMNMKDLQPEIANILRTMKIGDVSNPALVGNSVVIVKLISLPEIAAGDFDKVRDQIYSALYDQKIEETLTSYLQRERQKAFIEIR